MASLWSDKWADVPGQWSFIGLEWVLRSPDIQWMVVYYTILIAVVWSIAALRLWFCGAEIYAAPNAAFNISDGWGDAIGCAYVAKLSVLGTSSIDAHASAGVHGCRAKKIQWAGTLQ